MRERDQEPAASDGSPLALPGLFVEANNEEGGSAVDPCGSPLPWSRLPQVLTVEVERIVTVPTEVLRSVTVEKVQPPRPDPTPPPPRRGGAGPVPRGTGGGEEVARR